MSGAALAPVSGRAMLTAPGRGDDFKRRKEEDS